MSLFTRTRAAGLGGVSTSRFSFEAFEQEEQQMIETGEAGPLTMAAADGETQIVEAAVETAELSADVDEAQRSAAVLDKAEDVAEVQSNIDNATENDVMAAETSQAVVTTALGDDETNTAEGSESWVGRRISNEGFVDWIKAAWQKLKDFVMSLWTKAKVTWRKFINGTGSLVKEAKDLKEKLKDKKDSEKSDDELEYGAWATYLADTQTAKLPEQPYSMSIKDDYKELNDADKAIKPFSDLVKSLKEIKADESLDVIKPKMHKEIDATLKGLAGDASKDRSVGQRFGTGAKAYPTIMQTGNKALFYIFGADGSFGSKTPAELINSISVKFEDYHKDASFGKPKKDVKFKAPDKSPLSTALDNIESNGKELEKYFEKTTSEIEKKANELKKDIDKIVTDAKDDFVTPQLGAVHSAITRLHMVPLQILRATMSQASWMVQREKAILSCVRLCVNNLKNDSKD